MEELLSKKPAMTKQQEKFSDSSKSGLLLYKELVVGSGSWLSFLGYEFSSLLINGLSGLLGFGLREKIYPLFLNKCGRRPAFGKGLVIRQPGKISLGDKVLIDDYATLDARGDAAKISLGNHVTVGRFSTIVSKSADVSLSDGVNIGTYARIASQSRIEIGESTLIAAYAYIGPGNHQIGDSDTPLISQEMEIRGGVKIGSQVWIGTRATILDGVTIGNRAIIGAHSLVRDNVPEGAIVAGTPARIIKYIDDR